MKPIVLITGNEGYDAQYGSSYFMLNMQYSEFAAESGVTPVMPYDIRTAEEYAKFADGLLLTGGHDIHVGWYGQFYRNMEEAAFFSSTRDDLEFSLCKKFLDYGKPIFGIGRGMEILNVVLGGTLNRNVEEKYGEKHEDGQTHQVVMQRGAMFSDFFNEKEMVNSYHHQSVEQLGKGLIVASKTEKGVIEAVEHIILPVAGVMWHPERSEKNMKTKCTVLCRRLFKGG